MSSTKSIPIEKIVWLCSIAYTCTCNSLVIFVPAHLSSLVDLIHVNIPNTLGNIQQYSITFFHFFTLVIVVSLHPNVPVGPYI